MNDQTMAEYFQDLAQQFMNPYTAIAQIIGFIYVIIGFFAFRNISRTATLAIKALCDGMAVVHFAMLGLWTGAAVCTINVARGLCFAQKDRKKWASGIWMPILFCLLTIGGSLLGWTGWESLLPMVGSCLAVMGYWCKDTAKLRLFNLVGISMWVVYGVITLSISTILANSIYVISILLTMIRLAIKKEEQHD